MSKKITLEKLAQMVVNGFETTATKKDLEKCATKEDLKKCSTKDDLRELKNEIVEIKAKMVTKTFLEDKLADLEGNVILRQRKEDKKVNLIIELLKKKKVFGPSELKTLSEIKIFPQ